MEIKQTEFDLATMNDNTALVPYTDLSIYRSKAIIKTEKILKRIVDIIGGFVGLVILIPLTVIIFIVNLVSGDKGPVFYYQEKRIGENGKTFRMYKFRSMVVDADEKLKQYLKENKEARKEYQKYKKLKNDPRITKIGAFLRKTSLDEFPQFINVLKGEMSLVGPRPYLEREKDDMIYYYKYITACKPGVTGLWQISGRNGTTFKERMSIDMNYIRNHSLKMDIKILFKTIEKVVKKEGAI